MDMDYTFSDSGSEDPEDSSADYLLKHSGFLEEHAQEALDILLGDDDKRLRPRHYAGQTPDFSKMFTGQDCWEVNPVRRPSIQLRQRVAPQQSTFASRLLTNPLVAAYNSPSRTHSNDRNYFCEACAVCMPAREQDWQIHSTGISHQCQMLSLCESG